MNKISERTILACLLIGVIIAFGMAASEDYNQRVIETIPNGAYTEIVQKLGYGCSNEAIVKEFEADKDYYSEKQ